MKYTDENALEALRQITEEGKSLSQIVIDGEPVKKTTAMSLRDRGRKLAGGVTPDAKVPIRVGRESIPARVFGDTINGSIEAAQWADETVKALEDRLKMVKPEPSPEPPQPAPAKRDGFGKFVTISLILVGVTIAGITAYHFTAFGELGMSWGFSVILSLALEAGFWASMVQVSHKDTEHYWTFELLSGALIVYRLLANTSGIFAHAHDHHARLFSVELHGWQVWVYAILLASLLTLFDVVIARITVERLINQSKS
jgi:hypothetical protein